MDESPETENKGKTTVKAIFEMTTGELAAFIQTHMRAKGIEIVLTGGSVVSIYSQGKYVSKDLDFVVESFTQRRKLKDVMEEIGFKEVGRHFEHPDAAYLVEFPGGPLSVGKQRVENIETMEFETGVLKIISPTDCVKDRLAAYFFWNDHQSLDQAVMVAQDHKIDLGEIADWTNLEGMQDEYRKVEDRLK